jgi:hypothetical protein
MLAKRVPKLHARNREIFYAGTALGCVMTLMLCMSAVSTSHVNYKHYSSPGKLVRSAMPDDDPTDRPSVMNAVPVADSFLFDTARHWTAKHPQIMIAVFVYQARSIPNRAPPFLQVRYRLSA